MDKKRNKNEYALYLHSRKYNFQKLSIKNKQIKQSLRLIRKKFKSSGQIIRSKEGVISSVHKIIPQDFFGCRKNEKLFINLVRMILNHRKREVVHISLLTKDFENTFQWSSLIQGDDDFEETLRYVNSYLLDKCVKPLITKHFFPVSNLKSYEIKLVPRTKWLSFRDDIFQTMLSKRHVKHKPKYAEYAPRGALRILPKGNWNSKIYRPVICYYARTETRETYNYLCQLKKRIKEYVNEKKLHSSTLHTSWGQFVQKTRFKKVYGVKADIADSFGSINLKNLCEVIYCLPESVLQNKDKEFITKRIKKQYVSFYKAKNRIVLRWCHGLLQGDRLSSVLCELYYLELVDLKLLKHCMVGDFFFHRTVDDYMFCSTNKQNVEMFISNLKFSEVLNQSKLFSNVLNEELTELPYCGYIFNLETKEIIIEITGKNDLRHKIKLYNEYIFSSPNIYLTNVMKFCTANFYFSKVVLNTSYNSEETVLKIYYNSMIYLALKFGFALTELEKYHKQYFKNVHSITKKVLEIISIYVTKTLRIIEKFKGTLFQGNITFGILLTIGVRAFILVLKTRGDYKEIISSLRKKVFLTMSFFGDLNISDFNKVPTNMVVKKLK